MKKSQVFVGCLSLLVGFIAATALNRSSAGQPPATQPVKQEVTVWRYQLAVPTGGAFNGSLFLIDTATGYCWLRSNFQGAEWVDWGSPAERK
jgi:hypothetical protein